jgi:hypothetical protein
VDECILRDTNVSAPPSPCPHRDVRMVILGVRGTHARQSGEVISWALPRRFSRILIHSGHYRKGFGRNE